MKKFFFRLFLLLLLFFLGYALFLGAPFGLFFYSFQALNESEEAFSLELSPLSGLIIVEEGSKTEAALVTKQTLTYALSAEVLERLLLSYLEERPLPGIPLNSLEVMIAPEMLSLRISWQCELFGYRFYDNTVFSEWLIRLAKDKEQTRIEIKPKELHSNHLYSVNLAEFWEDFPWVDDNPDGWFALDSSSRLNIQELILQDGAAALTLGQARDAE